MRILLDTHMLLWSLSNDPKLPEKARDLIMDRENELFYSVASMREVTIKHLAHPDRMRISGSKLAEGCDRLGIQSLAITQNHVRKLETLKRPETALAHNDPFDKILIAQAKAEDLIFLTHDSLIPYYQETCILHV